MNVNEYIAWCHGIDQYRDSREHGSASSWGFRSQPLSEIERKQVLQVYKQLRPTLAEITEAGHEGYDHVRADILNTWAQRQYRDIMTRVEAKIQIQRPGERCEPHIDMLPGFLEKIVKERPDVGERAHTLDHPGVECFRLFVAMEDHVPGQVFEINGQQWQWRAGDQITMDPWRAIHHTENNSDNDRVLLKITGAKY